MPRIKEVVESCKSGKISRRGRSFTVTWSRNIGTHRYCGFESWRGATAWWPWASYLHLCASVTTQ